MNDIEDFPPPHRYPWLNHVLGYPMLAERMGYLPSSKIFRRFSALNARNLLYIQAELSLLESDLHVQEKADKEPGAVGSNTWQYSTDYRYLLNSARSSSEAPGASSTKFQAKGSVENTSAFQIELIQQIRAKLKEYSTSLFDKLPTRWMMDPGVGLSFSVP
ncbi:hypothetical protein B0J11DRAFT_517159 [Dendryphion nanum]|uniref:DUF6594 domain-containing protein n=1 Tax=Dendryphion nanum TaxID=256645 RepID=A0A9P9EAP1_9PLEO|nr:hypothetical protein B0J11DRAFT_517159 [Dendryphion nanum]